jgi:hypothetical protein
VTGHLLLGRFQLSLKVREATLETVILRPPVYRFHRRIGVTGIPYGFRFRQPEWNAIA